MIKLLLESPEPHDDTGLTSWVAEWYRFVSRKECAMSAERSGGQIGRPRPQQGSLGRNRSPVPGAIYYSLTVVTIQSSVLVQLSSFHINRITSLGRRLKTHGMSLIPLESGLEIPIVSRQFAKVSGRRTPSQSLPLWRSSLSGVYRRCNRQPWVQSRTGRYN